MERDFKQTQQQGHPEYLVIRDMELRAEPIEMKPKVEYSLPRRVIEQVRKVVNEIRS